MIGRFHCAGGGGFRGVAAFMALTWAGTILEIDIFLKNTENAFLIYRIRIRQYPDITGASLNFP